MSATFQHLYIGNQTLFTELNPICLRGLNEVTRTDGRTIADVITKAREEEVDNAHNAFVLVTFFYNVTNTLTNNSLKIYFSHFFTLFSTFFYNVTHTLTNDSSQQFFSKMRNKDLAFKQSQDLPISGLSTQP
jgi:hypothetical protein